VLAANVAKQAALHLPDPLRKAAAGALDAGLRGMGVDPVDKESTSYWEQPRFELPPAGCDGDSAANWAQFLLLLALLPAWPRLGRPARLALACSAAGALLFCAALKWQPWASRLHTPGFAFASVALGLGLAAWPPRLALAAALGMALAGLPMLLHMEERPLLSSHSVLSVPRWEQFFRGKERYRAPLEAALKEAESCRKIGIVVGNPVPEYLIWEGLKRQGKPFELRHLGTPGASARLEKADFKPCLLLGYEPRSLP
jgi:hypothetical protein